MHYIFMSFCISFCFLSLYGDNPSSKAEPSISSEEVHSKEIEPLYEGTVSQEENNEETGESLDVDQTDNLDQMLALIEEVDIPTPALEERSSVVVALQPYFISLAYKYPCLLSFGSKCNAIAQWVKSKFH